MSPDAIRALRAKYTEIRALRRSDEPRPQPRLRALAKRFPGALRELDELPLETIDARMDALDAALDGDAPPPPWAETLSRYHGWMRVALELKRAVGRDRKRDAARAWIDAHYPASDEPDRAAVRERLELILRPPGGRLSPLVLRWIAEELGGDPEELAIEAFPPSPKRCSR